MSESKVAAAIPGIAVRFPARAARPPEAKWSPRKTLLFIMAASTLGWMTVLAPLLSAA